MLVARARHRLDSGETMVSVARDLEVQQTSLRHWMRQFEGPVLRPVEIIGASASASVSASAPSPITILTPDGFLIEGLDVAGAATLLERLR